MPHTAHIVECLNPFKPFSDPKKHQVPAGTVLRDWLKTRFPGFVEFERPTICVYNGDYLLRKDWDRVLQDGDIVGFVAQPGGPLLPYVWYALISIVIGVGIALLMPKPGMQTNDSDTIYTIRGQQNRVRLGEPVEVPYGRCRLYPSYGALPYNRFEGNDQYQYSLFCLGQGEYDIDEIQIEDTPIGNFQDVTYVVYGPNQPVTLFDDNVVTSVEVSDIELFGTNETEYVQWVGPFVVNESGTTITRIELDFSMPLGLNHITDKGKVRTGEMAVSVEFRSIDNSGTPTSDWASLYTRAWSMATTKAQRSTASVIVPSGRYQVRVSRTSAKDEDNGSAQMLLWSALRGYKPSVRDYGDKTMLAVKMKATNNLNDRSAFRVNVWATRKLPIWDASTGWSAPQATRSIVWAFCDVIRSLYGGNLDSTYLPLTELQEQDAIYTAQGRYFDYIFDTRITVWEALRLIARIGRAVPMIEGSQIKLIRDTVKTLPECLFNQNNIVKDSFSWNTMLPKDGDYDGVLVRYTDPNDFLPREIKCLLGDDGTAIAAPRGSEHPDDDIGDNLEPLDLLGCTDPDWAFREGMYHRRCVVSRRQSAKWKTGLEGHIPRFGTMVGVSHDGPRWGSGGTVVLVAEDNRTLTLSEPAVFSTGAHCIAIRTRNGLNTGPLVCTAGEDEFHVVLAADLPEDVLLSDETENPVYLFGKSTLGGSTGWTKNLIVSRITPDSDNTVALEAVLYDASVFTDDGAFAPEIPDHDTNPTPPDIPTLDCSSVQVAWLPGSNTEGIVSWAPAYGARRYELQKSVDSGTSWSDLASTESTSVVIPMNEGVFLLRIRALGIGAGTWCVSERDFTEPADPWTTDSIPVGGDFSDLDNGLALEPLTPSIEYRTRSGQAGLLGYSVYDGMLNGSPTNHATTPPTLYRKRTLGGGLNWYINDGMGGVSSGQSRAGGVVGWEADGTPLSGGMVDGEPADHVVSGNYGWAQDYATASFAHSSGLSAFFAFTKTAGLPSGNSMLYDSGYYVPVGTMEWTSNWGTPAHITATGMLTESLSEPDTTDAAVARFLTNVGWLEWSTTPAASWQEVRAGSAVEFDVVCVEHRATAINAVPDYLYEVTDTYETCPDGSSTWTEEAPIVRYIQSNSSGVLEVPAVQIELTEGVSRRLKSTTIVPLI